MRVWRMTDGPGRAIQTTSSSERGIARDWNATFVVEAGLGFEVGDQVTAIATPWAGAMMGGRVTSYLGELLDVRIDSAIGEGTFDAWEIMRAGGAGDWRLGNGAGDFYQDQAEGTVQVILTRLRLFRGDWFLNVEQGTPWYEAVLGVRTRDKVEPALRAEILGAPDVRAILAFNMTVLERTVSIQVEADTVFGPVTIQGVL